MLRGNFFSKLILFFCLIIFAYLLFGCENHSAIESTSEKQPTMIRESSTPNPTKTNTATASFTLTPSPTVNPVVWRQVFAGEDLPRDTVSIIVSNPQNPEFVFAGLHNTGVFRSADGGLTWKGVNQGLDNLHIITMAIDNENPQRIYAGTRDGIYLSLDGGNEWTYLIGGSHILIDPNDSAHIYAYENFLFESFDRGETWSRFDPGCLIFWDIVIDPANGNTLYATDIFGHNGCQAGIYRSNNSGHNWILVSKVENPMNPVYSLAAVLDQSGNTYIYAGSHIPRFSKDGGDTWEDRTFGCDFLPSQSDRSHVAYCYNYAGVTVMSPDQNWQTFSGLENAEISAIRLDSIEDMQRYIAGGHGIYLSTDNGATWKQQNQGIGISWADIRSHPLHAEILYLAIYLGEDEQQCNLYRSMDSGDTWKNVSAGRHITWCGPTFSPTGTLYNLYEGKLNRSKDDGTSWVSSHLPYDTYYWVNANPYIEGNLFAVSENGLYYSTDAGSTWQISKVYSNTYIVHNGPLYFAPDGNLIYNVLSFTVSEDGGKTFTPCRSPNGFPTSRYGKQLAIDPLDGEHIFLATNGQGVQMSRDGCQSWVAANRGLSNLYVNAIVIDPIDPEIIYAGTEKGLFVTYDSGDLWQEINTGLIENQIFSVEININGDVFAMTSAGLFQLESDNLDGD